MKKLIKKRFFNLRKITRQRFNIKMGTIAGLITGSIVFYINYKFGFAHAFFAFLKQFLFNFLMASYNTKLVERLVYGIKNSFLAIITAGIVPTIIATTVVFMIHYIGQTPQAWQSSYWQAFFNFPIFTITAIMYQTGYERRFKLLKSIFITKSSSNNRKY